MQVLSFVNKCALFLLCYEDYFYYLSLSLSLCLISPDPMEQWAFEPKQEPKIDVYVCMYVYIHISAGRSLFLVGCCHRLRTCLHNEDVNGTMNPT